MRITCVIIFILVLFIVVYGKRTGKPSKDEHHRHHKHHKHNENHKAHRKAARIQSGGDAFKFLDRFGYNKCGTQQIGKKKIEGPLCQSNIEAMIRHFQILYRLPVTGKLDNSTLTLMNTPRCSLGDYPLAYSAFKPWPNRTLTWKLHNEIPKFDRNKIRLHIQEAFGDWARYAPLIFREVVGNERADFNIGFYADDHDDGYPFDGPGATLAHAFFPTDGKVHFDAMEEWTDKYDGFGYNFRLVASHEIGHALGLAHSNDPKSLMYPFYQLIQPEDLLPKDDRDGIRALYGTSDTNKPTTFASTTMSTTTKKGATTKKPPKTTTSKIRTTTQQYFAHDRCARYLDVVFGGGPDKWLYTLDYDVVWRYHPDFNQWDTRGLPITDVFPGAEAHMMAGILSPTTGKIYLFKGYRIWRFSPPNILDSGFPKRLYGVGTPFNPVAALYEEDHIWLLKGGVLFKFDEDTLQYEFDQTPRSVDVQFPGVPRDVRTAFTHDGKHYFFTEPDRLVYVFDTKTRRILSGYPKPMTTGWFACNK